MKSLPGRDLEAPAMLKRRETLSSVYSHRSNSLGAEGVGTFVAALAIRYSDSSSAL